MRQNCDNCTGPVREACDALFAEVRDYTGSALTRVVTEDLVDKQVGLMELQDEMTSFAQNKGRQLRELGCTLGEAALVVAFHSEYMTGIMLAATELEEAEEAEEEESRQRIEKLLKETDQLLGRVKAKEQPSSLQTDSSPEALATRDTVIESFCAVRNLDVDSLSYVDQLELSAHLKKMGLKGMFE